MKNRYTYPAILKVNDNGFDVIFPDIDSCFTFGDSLEDALDSARDVLELCIYDMEQDGKEIPTASAIEDIILSDGEFISWISVWMAPVRDKLENKSVKKTLTIPKWLNDLGMEQELNFSQILQSAIKEKLGIYESKKDYGSK